MIKINHIYNEDCLEIMKCLPNNFFDLVITDPPYGITSEKWDKKPDYRYFDEIFRISKNQIIFGANHFGFRKSGGWLVWNKRPFLPRVNPLEFIFTSFGKYDEMLDYTLAGNCQGWHGQKLQPNYNKRKCYHLAEKPLEVCRFLLKKFAKKNDLIFDPFAGSGSFLVACKEMGFEWVGCEIDKGYYKIIEKRLSQHSVFDIYNKPESEVDISQPLAEQQEGGKGVPPTPKECGYPA